MGLPLVQFILDAALDAGQATEGREEGLVARQNIEMELEVVGRIDGNRTIFYFAQRMGSGNGKSADAWNEPEECGGVEGDVHGLVVDEGVPDEIFHVRVSVDRIKEARSRGESGNRMSGSSTN